MTAALPLLFPEAHSRWSTWAGVGIGLIVVGLLLDYFSGALDRPTSVPGEGVLVLSIFLFGSGLAFIIIGLVLRSRERNQTPGSEAPL